MMATAEREIEHPNIVLLSESKRRIERSVFRIWSGHFNQDIGKEVGDFIVLRKDKLFAYHLAVVVDDEYQKISHVVRGGDLLSSTPRQIYLQQLLDFQDTQVCSYPGSCERSGCKAKQTKFFTRNRDRGMRHIYFFRLFNFLGRNHPTIYREHPLESYYNGQYVIGIYMLYPS